MDGLSYGAAIGKFEARAFLVPIGYKVDKEMVGYIVLKGEPQIVRDLVVPIPDWIEGRKWSL